MIPTNWLTHRARTRPDELAVRDREGRTLTHAELLDRAAPIAVGLARDGRPRTIELEPGIDQTVAAGAAMLAAVPFQIVRPGLPERERRATLEAVPGSVPLDPGPTEIEAGADERSRCPASAGDTLCHVLTSGTSGARKPVALTYANHFCSAAASAFNLGVRPDDRWLCCLPTDHVGGLNILIRSAIYGTAAIVHPRFDPDSVAAELERDATMVSLVPTQLARLLDSGAPLHHPRLILLGGALPPGDLLERAEAAGAAVVQTYGLTEACSQVTTLGLADAQRKRGSAGRPLPGIGLEIVDGEIVVSGPTVAPGAAAEDGLLHTGDRGRIDDEGFLWVEGRLDDLIVTGGENVAPEEVEQVLLGHPAVVEAAVFGRPHPEWGEAVCAVVVTTGVPSAPAPGAPELTEHCRRSLARHKVPKAIEVVAELPRTPMGKLRRSALR